MRIDLGPGGLRGIADSLWPGGHRVAIVACGGSPRRPVPRVSCGDGQPPPQRRAHRPAPRYSTGSNLSPGSIRVLMRQQARRLLLCSATAAACCSPVAGTATGTATGSSVIRCAYAPANARHSFLPICIWRSFAVFSLRLIAHRCFVVVGTSRLWDFVRLS